MSKIIGLLIVLFVNSSYAITTQYKAADCKDTKKLAQVVIDVQNQVFCSASADENLCEDLEKFQPTAATVAALGVGASAVGISRAIRALEPTVSCPTKSADSGLSFFNKAWAAGTCSIGANIFQVAKEQIELEEKTLKDMKSKLLEILGGNPNAKPTNETQKRAKRELVSVNKKLNSLDRRKKSFNTLANRARNIDASKFNINFGEELWTRDKFGQKSNAKKYGIKALLGIETVTEEVISRAPYKTRMVTKVLDQQANNLFKEVFEPNISVFDSPSILDNLDDLKEKKGKVKAHNSRLAKSALYSRNMADADWRNSVVKFSGNTGKAAFRKALAAMFFSAGIVLEVAASPTAIGCDDASSKGLDPRFNLFQRGSNCNEFKPVRKLSDPGVVELFTQNSAEEIVSFMLKGGEYDVRGEALCKALLPLANSSGVRGWQGACTTNGVSLQPRRHNYDHSRPYGQRIEVYNTESGYDVYNSYSPVGFGSNGQYYASFNNSKEVQEIRQTRARGHLGEKFSAEKLEKVIAGVKKSKTSDEFSKAAGYAHRYSLQAVNQTRRCCTEGSDISQSICNAYGIKKAGLSPSNPSVNTGSGSGSN